MWKQVLDLTGEDSLEFAALAIEAVVEISADEVAADIFKRRRFDENEDREAIARKIAQESIKALLRNHKDMLFRLFAANAGITEEEYRQNVTPLRVSADISAMVMDEGFRAFFGFAQTNRKQYGSAQENTGERRDSSDSCSTAPQKRKRRKKKKYTGTTQRNV